MNAFNRDPRARLYLLSAIACGSLVAVAGVTWASVALVARSEARPGAPFANMPALAPIGVRVDTYLDVPDSAKGPAVDPAKGYRTLKLGDGLYMITDGAYQSAAFDVYIWDQCFAMEQTFASSETRPPRRALVR